MGLGAHPAGAERRSPVVGVVLAILGLVLVLDLSGQARPDLVGVAWGLVAAAGLATYFVLAAEETSLPPVALAGLGMGAGAVALGLLGAVGVVPMAFAATPVELAGPAGCPGGSPSVSWPSSPPPRHTSSGSRPPASWARPSPPSWGSPRCCSRCCSPGCCSASCPGSMQLAGGVLIVGGVVAVRLGELRRDRAARATRADDDADFPLPAGVA